MVRASISIGRVPVAWHYDFSAQRLGPYDCGVDVVNLKPEEQAVSRRHVRIADASVVMFLLPAVKLQHQLTEMNEPFVIRPAVGARVYAYSVGRK